MNKIKLKFGGNKNVKNNRKLYDAASKGDEDSSDNASDENCQNDDKIADKHTFVLLNK